jgi:hypothetical protein
VKIEIQNDTLILGNRKHVFENTIGQIIALDNIVFVLLLKRERNRINVGKQTGNNVYALTPEGDILWNIFEILKEYHCIGDMEINDDNQLILFSASGAKIRIDIMKKCIIDVHASRFN